MEIQERSADQATVPINQQSPPGRLVAICDDGQHYLGFKIDRGNWLKRVLEPIGMGKYVMMDMRVPDVPNEAHWAKALDLLKKAEEQYVLGNDPGVFQYCKAIFDDGMLPGAPNGTLFAAEGEAQAVASADQGEQVLELGGRGRP